MAKNTPPLRLAMAGALLWLALAPTWARDQPAPPWQDDFQSRLEAYALMQTLSTDILGSPSATRSLEKWCREHRLAAVPSIVAQRVFGEDKPVQPEQMLRLEVGNPEQVKYRKVRLMCGDQVLSEADNWYVPSRLTAEMNRLLETTETPFGKAIAALQPSRQTLTVKMLWSPLPEGWESQKHSSAHRGRTHVLAIPDALFEHQTLLYGRDRKPISEVHEVYQRAILALPRPAAR